MAETKLSELKGKTLPPGARWHKCTKCKRNYWHYTKVAGECQKPDCHSRWLDRMRLNE